ncbi:MAG: hypothetical protein WD267_00780 [Balneolales bacterium]
MLVVKLLLLIVVFIASSFGSGWLLNRYGYHVPHAINNREDYILIAMKIVLFMILMIVQLVILLLIGVNPFRF